MKNILLMVLMSFLIIGCGGSTKSNKIVVEEPIEEKKEEPIEEEVIFFPIQEGVYSAVCGYSAEVSLNFYGEFTMVPYKPANLVIVDKTEDSANITLNTNLASPKYFTNESQIPLFIDSELFNREYVNSNFSNNFYVSNSRAIALNFYNCELITDLNWVTNSFSRSFSSSIKYESETFVNDVVYNSQTKVYRFSFDSQNNDFFNEFVLSTGMFDLNFASNVKYELAVKNNKIYILLTSNGSRYINSNFSLN